MIKSIYTIRGSRVGSCPYNVYHIWFSNQGRCHRPRITHTCYLDHRHHLRCPLVFFMTNLLWYYWMTSRRNLGESRSVVQTLFYGLRKSRKNAIPVASFPRCDITMSHVYLIRVLHYNMTRWIHLCGNTLVRMYRCIHVSPISIPPP